VAEKVNLLYCLFFFRVRGDSLAEDITVLPGTKRSSWLKWIVVVLVILAVLWYLNYAGYISLPFL
jgi:hypothetical protein